MTLSIQDGFEYRIYGINEKTINRNGTVPVVLYLHGLLHGEFSEREINTKNINIDKVTGVQSLLERMKESPFVLIVPICYDYKWENISNDIVSVVQAALSLDFTEGSAYVVGHRYGAGAAVELAMAKENINISTVTMIDPLLPRREILERYIPTMGKKRINIIQSKLNNEETFADAREVKELMHQHGNFLAVLEERDDSEMATLTGTLRGSSFLI